MRIKEAKISVPELTDRKLHVQRRIRIEADKTSHAKSEWESFVSDLLILLMSVILIIAFILMVSIPN